MFGKEGIGLLAYGTPKLIFRKSSKTTLAMRRALSCDKPEAVPPLRYAS
jgi:hypothetical protein